MTHCTPHEWDSANLCAYALLVLCIFGSCTLTLADETTTPIPKLSVNLGNELSESELEALPVHVFSDGAGLPEGSGTAMQGATLYATHCANCHGSAGQGAKALELVGDRSLLTTAYPDRGVAVYWPYAPTLFEYIQRSMPPATPGIFSSDEMYGLIAYLLYLNELIDDEFELQKESLSNLVMPNRDGFDTIAK